VKVSDLIVALMDLHEDTDVFLEVGGDGAVHTGFLRSIQPDHHIKPGVVLSSERDADN